MDSPLLTIRNLSADPLKLILIERYEAPSSPPTPGGGVNIANITRSFTALVTNTTSTAAPTSPQLAENAQNFSRHELSVALKPFKTTRTDIKSAEKSASESLRLTFEHRGEKYRLDVPSPTPGSNTLVPLTPNPQMSYTAVYHKQQAHLTLFSSTDLACWMKNLRDETPLPALSIPGTHNSPTCHRALPSVRCQAVGVREQLENGVRFLDIRVQPESPEDASKDGLVLVHGVFPISLTGSKYFRDLVNEVHAFLDRNPSETVIMSVKREGPGTHTDAQLSRKLRDHYAGDVHRWFTAPRIPKLGEARRKIVLLRRFGLEEGLKKEWDGQGWCIDAETWTYNTPNDTCHSGDVCVQDFCEVLETENIDKKIKFSEDHLRRAASCVCELPHSIPPTDATSTQAEHAATKTAKQPFFVNFLSASNFWKVGCWPEKIAAKLNPAIVDFLCRQHHSAEANEKAGTTGDGSTGIVVCDWVGNGGDWDLVRCIVAMNAKLEIRERSLVGGEGEGKAG
ncbi:MAG: hypothetical protein M1825_003695 [Sarcosagium campestre]|nr:MAG: hypothetical protein M1825_003695 [Sarcosagium campestre]